MYVIGKNTFFCAAQLWLHSIVLNALQVSCSSVRSDITSNIRNFWDEFWSEDTVH